MSDTPRIDEELKNNCYMGLNLDFMRNLERELNDAKIRVSQAVEKMENATSYKNLPQVVYDALDILKGGTDAQQIRDYYEEQEEEPEKQDDRPRFKPEDKVWIVDEDDGEHIRLVIENVAWDHLGVDYFLYGYGPEGIPQQQVFATKQELIESL